MDGKIYCIVWTKVMDGKIHCIVWSKSHGWKDILYGQKSWMVRYIVLYGQKSWMLFPPGQDELLYIYPNRKCHFPLDCVRYDSPIDAFVPDSTKYPHFDKAQYLEVTVTAGEMLIIPTGWYHQAFNEEETLAISSQIMNRNNYLAVLEEIIKGGNISRKKLPAYFNTLLPPDQVRNNYLAVLEEIIKGGNISRKKLPAYFNTLLPPDQVRNNYLALLEEIIKGGNISREKLPAYFNTLLPPDQVRNNYLAMLEEIIKGGNISRKKLPAYFNTLLPPDQGGNISRKKLPAYFNTLLPPDQVKLFLSLLHKKILKKGKEVTEGVLKGMHQKKVMNI
ncbi:JMJD6 [Mytilus edulis]|uniref:JMJD6 n=1 Tax=Mytilus edulis TaxID=6550 RepID=A0A8S3R190_MYTED|nr:JMJD6 [Mytilus edulis]